MHATTRLSNYIAAIALAALVLTLSACGSDAAPSSEVPAADGTLKIGELSSVPGPEGADVVQAVVVADDNQPASITHVSSGDLLLTADDVRFSRASAGVVLLVDDSTAMAERGLTAVANGFIQAVAHRLDPHYDRLAAMKFADEARVRINFSGSRSYLQRRGLRLSSDGPQCLYPALVSAVDEANRSSLPSRVVLAVTAGGLTQDSACGPASADDAVAAATNSNIPILLVQLGSDVVDPDLEAIAQDTGGATWPLTGTDELTSVAGEISDFLDARTYVSFERPAAAASAIEIRAEAGDRAYAGRIDGLMASWSNTTETVAEGHSDNRVAEAAARTDGDAGDDLSATMSEEADEGGAEALALAGSVGGGSSGNAAPVSATAPNTSGDGGLGLIGNLLLVAVGLVAGSRLVRRRRERQTESDAQSEARVEDAVGTPAEALERLRSARTEQAAAESQAGRVGLGERLQRALGVIAGRMSTLGRSRDSASEPSHLRTDEDTGDEPIALTVETMPVEAMPEQRETAVADHADDEDEDADALGTAPQGEARDSLASEQSQPPAGSRADGPATNGRGAHGQASNGRRANGTGYPSNHAYPSHPTAPLTPSTDTLEGPAPGLENTREIDPQPAPSNRNGASVTPAQPEAPAAARQPPTRVESHEVAPFALVGTVCGRYRLEAPLGRGGLGEVYRARDLQFDRTVAVKVLYEDSFAGADAFDALMREVSLVDRITHHNVVRIYDVIRFEGRVAIVMEYIKGQSLSAIARETGTLSPEDFDLILSGVAEALDAAHAAGVVHGDVTPGNVLISQDGKIKLCDFGVGRLVGDDPTAPRAGTPRFVAPEMLAGHDAGPRSDIYSLGALTLMMVAGRDADVGDLAPGFQTVLKSALEPQPEMRCATAGALAAAFHAAVEEELHRKRGPLAKIVDALRGKVSREPQPLVDLPSTVNFPLLAEDDSVTVPDDPDRTRPLPPVRQAPAPGGDATRVLESADEWSRGQR